MDKDCTKPIYFTKSELLNNRGWPKTAVQSLLPKPIQKRNPYYTKAAPMLLWEEKIVLAAEESDEFKNLKSAKERRRNKSLDACARSAQMLEDEMLHCPIRVKRLSEKTLKQRTLLDKESWDREFSYSVRDADEQTIQRWMVNYIRHNLTNYETICEGLYNKVGNDKAYQTFKDRVLSKIADEYPFLSDECNEQMSSDV